MSPKQIKRLQIFIILFLSCVTLYVLFKEAKKKEKFNQDQQEIIESKSEPSLDSIKESEPLQTKASNKKIKTPLTAKQVEALENFRQQAKTILEKLPLKSDLQKLDEGQTHSIPQELLQTGRELGKLKELVIKYPEFKELQDEAKTYYKTCAEQDQYPTSIRSLCLFNRLQLAKNNGEDFDISKYPPEIKELVLELAPFRKP